MTDRIVIYLVEDEFNYEEAESYQDKISKLEEKVAKKEQEIDGIKEMIADLKNSSNEDLLGYNHKDSFIADLEGYSPICATAYPKFDCNARHFSNMHPLPQNEMKKKGGRHFNTETNQNSFTNELASQLGTNLVEIESENETPYNLVDIPMYDWIASIGQDNEFNMRLFVRTLTGPTLMWYANQDTWKWFSWVDMVKDFIKQYGPPNSAYKGFGLLKMKSIESPKGMKGCQSLKKIEESTLGHYCTNEAQSRDKEKIIVTEAPNVPLLVPEARKTIKTQGYPLDVTWHTRLREASYKPCSIHSQDNIKLIRFKIFQT
ncbi:hypothetical protein R3W88_024641 [Solanum pinnatisectum]|uniref:Retrotransposon gag domain-containing protein n=1 Tax=Solanum pinnatisectum TaxID=50273 RepID=A0AAV9M1N2_9SOLN|nr:hypothetical protein R3W88_024641 [Solanum pinnatisectum]